MPRISRPWRSQASAPHTEGGGAPDPHSNPGQPAADTGLYRPVEPPTPGPSTEAQSAVQASAAPAEAEPQAAGVPSIAGLDPPAGDQSPGFGERGRIRRRVHFLLKARELAYRDLGGLVFDLHRFGQRHDTLVAAKLSTLDSIDTELRTLQNALGERRSVTVLREAGVAACPRCAAIHGSDDRFCPSCGMPMGRRADRPITVASGAPTTQAPVAAQPSSPIQVPGQTSLALPGSAPIPTPPPGAEPSTRSWTAELAQPSAGLHRPSPPLEGAAEQRTQIVHPGEHRDLSRGALRDRPDETPPAR
jgi:hypothetical protein